MSWALRYGRKYSGYQRYPERGAKRKTGAPGDWLLPRSACKTGDPYSFYDSTTPIRPERVVRAGSEYSEFYPPLLNSLPRGPNDTWGGASKRALREGRLWVSQIPDPAAQRRPPPHTVNVTLPAGSGPDCEVGVAHPEGFPDFKVAAPDGKRRGDVLEVPPPCRAFIWGG